MSLQLYSVRNHCKQDFDKSLADVASLGYDGVEFAGYYKYGNKAKELKKKLDDLGLKAAGTHIRANSFDKNNIQKTIDFHKEIGCKYLIVPGDGRFSHPEQSKQYAELMNKAAEALKPHALYCGHHNHTSEFKIAEGEKTYWDLFAERTSDDVVLQQDVGWTVHAKRDPVMYIEKYPGRTKIVHFKPTAMEKSKKPIIGQDSVPWKEIISACRKVGGTEWATVEQEKYLPGKTPMECSGLSLNGLKELL
ncbi:hypothetical protein BVX94_01730 [bacterium B17]|nr:hypothetical protein BVX94_01730 [bacterium B17]